MTIEELRRLIELKEEAYHQALTEMEIALIRFKDRFVQRLVLTFSYRDERFLVRRFL